MEEDRYTRITLRIPKDLHAQLQQAADATSKSMNAEIVARLQATFDETIVTTVEARAQAGKGERFEFNADAIADKVMERLEGKASSNPNKVIIVGNLGRDPSIVPFSKEAIEHYLNVLAGHNLSDVQPRGNEPYGPKKSSNARRAKKI